MRSCQHISCVPILAGSPFVSLFFSEKKPLVESAIHGVLLGSKERFSSRAFMGMGRNFFLSRRRIFRVMRRTHSDFVFLFLPCPIGRVIFFICYRMGIALGYEDSFFFSGLRPCFFLPSVVMGACANLSGTKYMLMGLTGIVTILNVVLFLSIVGLY